MCYINHELIYFLFNIKPKTVSTQTQVILLVLSIITLIYALLFNFKKIKMHINIVFGLKPLLFNMLKNHLYFLYIHFMQIRDY